VRSLRFIAGLGLAGLASAIAAYALVSFMQGVRQEEAVALHAEEISARPTASSPATLRAMSASSPSSTTIAPTAGKARLR
jgi:hypothetical protein